MLAYVLTLEDPQHVACSRDVGFFLGLVPKRSQSGETDEQFYIGKAGDRLVRTPFAAHHELNGRLHALVS